MNSPRRRAIRIGRVASLLLMSSWFISCGSNAPQITEKARGVPVRTVMAEKRDIDEKLILTGTLKPRSQVQVVAEVSARLMRVMRDEGARVAAGEILAVLDETDYKLALDRASAALEVAEANRAHAIVERDRADNLLKTGGITDKDHLSAQVSLRVAEAALAQARAETAIASEQHARCQVKAPFAGRIAKRLADAGAMLATGTPIFTIVDDSALEYRASVPSSNYGKAKLGAEVDVTVDSLPGMKIAGRVARVTPFVDERSRTFDVVVEVPGRAELIGGLFARASVQVKSVPDAIVVPPAALIRDGAVPGEAQLFVVTGSVARKRSVRLGVETAEIVQVIEGVEAGEVVVLDPPVALADGAPVEIHGSAAAKSPAAN